MSFEGPPFNILHPTSVSGIQCVHRPRGSPPCPMALSRLCLPPQDAVVFISKQLPRVCTSAFYSEIPGFSPWGRIYLTAPGSFPSLGITPHPRPVRMSWWGGDMELSHPAEASIPQTASLSQEELPACSRTTKRSLFHFLLRLWTN